MLNDPIQAGNLTLKNRLVMPPMATEKSAGGAVSDALVRYYDEMSQGGYLGLIVLEHCYVSPEGKASPNQVSVAEDACIEPLRRIADAVHRNGVPLIAQISHAGSAAPENLTGTRPISPSEVMNANTLFSRIVRLSLPLEMTQDDIDRLIACFADAAARVQKAGFDGVEVHSAHGYLLGQFYSPLTNRRADQYTGSTLEGRTKLQTQIIEAVREKCGAGFLISLRWGACDYADGGAALDEVPAAARIFAGAGADLISISGNMCGYLRSGHSEQGWFAELSEAVKKSADVPVLLTGGITEKDAAEKLLAEGKADLIGVGRALLKNRKLPEAWMK